MNHPRVIRWRRIVRFLGILYVMAACVGCLSINRLMFHPPYPYGANEVPGLIEIRPSNAPVAGVWMPVEGAKRAVLFSYGNAEDLRFVHSRLESFNRMGLSALAYDYPGYGRTPGKPTEASVYAAAETAFRHLTDDCGFAVSNIVIVGYSIGSGPSCYLAEKHDVGGLLLFAPFKSAVRVVTQVRILPFDPFPNIARIPRTRCPVLVFHGTADRVIPFSHGRAVAKAAGGHGRFFLLPEETHDTIFPAVLADPEASAALRALGEGKQNAR